MYVCLAAEILEEVTIFQDDTFSPPGNKQNTSVATHFVLIVVNKNNSLSPRSILFLKPQQPCT